MSDHLWQSTVFAIAAALLAFAFRKQRAHVRYWLWFSASCKFLLPLGLLTALGSHLEWTPPSRHVVERVMTPVVAFTVQPFADVVPSATPSTTVASPILWACGFVLIVLLRVREWRRVRAAVRASSAVTIPAFDCPVKVRCSPGLLEPGVVGVLRPVLLLPAGLTERLTPPQLKAVLAHELCHVRRHDNLLAGVHMITEAIFWFHPLVWWIGARMLEERERACDEEVLRQTQEPLVYAEAIVGVCKLYAEWPARYVSGVTGADLKRRIEAITANRIGRRLHGAQKFVLACGAAAVLAIPFVAGIGAQTSDVGARFDVAAIKPNHSGSNGSSIRIAPGGRLVAENASLRALMLSAYQVKMFQISGGPPWTRSERFDVEAKGQLKAGVPARDQISHMLQTLLADRFQLRLHRETKEMPIFALLIAKNGPKLQPASNEPCFDPASGKPFPISPTTGQLEERVCGSFNRNHGSLQGTGVTTAHLAASLSSVTNRTVVDKTGLTGVYDVNLNWAEEALPDDPEPSVFTALPEQLGLRLESQKGPVEILVIDHAESPSEN